MTDDALHVAVVNWLASVVGVTVIMSYQSGPVPANPYIEVNFTGSRTVRDHEVMTEYDPPTNAGEEPDTGGEYPAVTAMPVIEREWQFSLHAYSDGQPSDLLRPIESACRLTQIMEPLLPARVHEMSQVRHIPDYVNEAWRGRAQCDLFLRGLTRDGFIIDVIDDTSFNIAPKET